MIKFIMLTLMMMMNLLFINSITLFHMWIFMEINNILFISLMVLFNNNHKKWEKIFSYFMIQAFSSMFLLISMIQLMFFNNNTNMIMFSLMFLFNLMLLMKLAMWPFHNWLPYIMNNLSWFNCFLIMSIQKIMPFLLLLKLKIYYLNMMSIIFSSILSSFYSLYYSNLKKILSLSSITHSSWMLMILLINFNYWMIYFTLYSMTLMLMIYYLSLLKFKSMNNYINEMIYNNKNLIFLILMLILMFSSIPPFSLFMIKWMSVELFNSQSIYITTFILLITSVISFYMYIRMMMLFFLYKFNSLNYLIKLNNSTNNNFMLYLSLLFLPLILNFYM